MLSIFQVTGFAILGGTAAIGGIGRLRRLTVGMVVLLLGIASARVALQIPAGAAVTAALLAGLPPLSRGIDAGLVVLGVLSVILDIVLLWRRPRRALAASAALGLVLAAWPGLALVASGLNGALLATVAGAGVFGWALLRLARSGLSRRLGGALHRALTARGTGHDDLTGSWWITVGAVAVMALVPNALAVLVAGMVMAVAAHLAARSAGRVATIPLLPMVIVPVLLVEAHYLRVIAGPVGLSTAALPDVPISPAAAATLAPPLLIASLAAASPVLLRRWLPTGITAVGGIALMVRLAYPLFGDALPGWETLFMPMGIVMLCFSALSEDGSGFAAMAAWTVVLVAEPAGAVAAWLLAGTAVLLAHPWPDRAGPAVAVAAGIAAGAGLSLGLPALLAHQVTYTLLAALALAVLLAGRPGPRAMVYSGYSHDVNAQSGADDALHTASPSI